MGESTPRKKGPQQPCRGYITIEMLVKESSAEVSAQINPSSTIKSFNRHTVIPHLYSVPGILPGAFPTLPTSIFIHQLFSNYLLIIIITFCNINIDYVLTYCTLGQATHMTLTCCGLPTDDKYNLFCHLQKFSMFRLHLDTIYVVSCVILHGHIAKNIRHLIISARNIEHNLCCHR